MMNNEILEKEIKNNSFCSCNKRNRIPRINKLRRRINLTKDVRDLYAENYMMLLK